MPRMNCRGCAQTTASASEAVSRSRAAEAEALGEDMPMCRYTNPIPVCSCGGDGCACRARDSQLLEALDRQSQLLTDLLGAVNSLTAALLSGRSYPCP